MDELGVSPIDALTYQKLGNTILKGNGDKAIKIIDKELEKEDIEEVPKALLSILRWLLETEPFSKILLNLPEVELKDVTPYVRLGKAIKDGKGERAISIINKELENEDLMTILKTLLTILRWLLETEPFSKILLHLPGSDITLKDVLPYVHLIQAIKDGSQKKAKRIIDKELKNDDIKTLPKVILKILRWLLETEPFSTLLLEGPKPMIENIKKSFGGFDKSGSDSESSKGHSLKLHGKFGKHHSGSDSSDDSKDGKEHKVSKEKGKSLKLHKLADDKEDAKVSKLKKSKLEKAEETETSSGSDNENEEEKGLFGRHKKLKDNEKCNISNKKDKMSPETNDNNVKLPHDPKDDTKPKLSKLKKSKEAEESSETDEENEKKKGLFGRHKKAQDNDEGERRNESKETNQEVKKEKEIHDTFVKLPDDVKGETKSKQSKLKKSKKTEESSKTDEQNEENKGLFGRHKEQTDNKELNKDVKVKIEIHDTFVKLPEDAKEDTKPKQLKLKKSKKTEESSKTDEQTTEKKNGLFELPEKVKDNEEEDNEDDISLGTKQGNIEVKGILDTFVKLPEEAKV